MDAKMHVCNEKIQFYCKIHNLVLNGCNGSSLESAQQIYSVLRRLGCSTTCAHAESASLGRDRLKIPERIEYKAISFTFNILQSSQLSYLRQRFTIQPSRSTRSSSALTQL